MRRLPYFAVWLFFSFCAPLSLAQVADQTLREKIIHATRFDDLKTLRQYAAQGGDVNLSEADRGENLLMLSIREDSHQIFDFLLTHPKIDLNQRANNGDTALMLTAYLEQKTKLQKLISAGAQVRQTAWTALHYACVVGNFDIVTILLEQQADIDAETPDKTTPLMLAARRGEMPVVKLLLDQGADISRKNMLGWTAYDFAVESERRDIARFLQQQMTLKKGHSN